jgi:hydrogenase expression/formation protein HypC
MCLAVPARIIEKQSDGRAIAALHGNRVPVSTAMTPDARVGDWVLLHAGFAIQQLDEKEASETWGVLQDLFESPSLATFEPLQGGPPS